MTIVQALVLGIIQGLTEFLPISSSGHLVVVPWLLKWPVPSVTFNVVLHLGTLTGVIYFFWSDIFKLLKSAFLSLKKGSFESHLARLAWFVILATIPAATFAALFKSFFESFFARPLITAGLLLFTALFLYLSESFSSPTRALETMKWRDSLIIGFFQVLAIFPGVSRSGVTIGTGILRGLTRFEATRFSFLISIPIIAGAAVSKIDDLVAIFTKAAITIPLIVGFVAAAASGYLAIKYLLKYLRRGKLTVFSYYCLGLAIIVFVVAQLRQGG